MTQDELRGRADALASSYLAQGVTFDFAGEERPWRVVEDGIRQRVRALEAFLSDVYGRQDAVRDGVIPARLISSSRHFHRQAAGVISGNGVRIQVSGIDLIRDEGGVWRVLEDNVRVPPGVNYVISNRRVMAQTLPELFVSVRLEYMPGVSAVSTTAREAWEQGKGVCQDITHLTIGALRSAGIPRAT